MPTVVLLGTLDTKGLEYAFLRDRVREHDVDVLLLDAGILGEPLTTPDISRDEIAEAGGVEVAGLVAEGDRGAAITAMARGAAEVVRRLHGEGRLDGILGLGGSGNSTLIAEAMRALPVGVPKLLVSTVASGDTRPYVGAVDIAMMYSVVDIAGINRISAQIMTNAAAMIAGAAKAGRAAGRRREAARRRHHVRRDDAVRDGRPRAAGGARVRGARLPRDRYRRAVDGGARPRRLPRGRPRRDHDRAGGRAGRRGALGGAGPARGRGTARAAAGRLARRPRHGELRSARDRASAVLRAQPVRPQRDDHAHAHDARGVSRARAPDRAEALGRQRARSRCSCR